MILIAKKWRGAVNIDSMRKFDDLTALASYIRLTGFRDDGFWHAWHIHTNTPPIRLTLAEKKLVEWVRE